VKNKLITSFILLLFLIIIYLYKVISNQENSISSLLENYKNIDITEFKNYIPAYQFELFFKQSLKDIKTIKSSSSKIRGKLLLEKYKLQNGFYSGKYLEYPGSGYLDFHEDKLIILSSRGVLGFSDNINKKLNFKQIQNNIEEFINESQYVKSNVFSLQDLKIIKDTIYISYSQEIKNNCWNTGIIFAKFNYQKIIFEKFFEPEECIHMFDNVDKEFEPQSAGGRIIEYDNSHILLSVGEYRARYLSQNTKSINGKILKINKNNFKYKIFSMGHRNPQGLFLDNKSNNLIITEHGPMGGDEINLIQLHNLQEEEILNFGWPISSFGEHYGGKINKNKKKYEKYPLYKSHKKYGFVEPIKSFTPSIGISEITKITENTYVLSALKDKSIYFFKLENGKIFDLKRVEVLERVRDIIFKDGKLYLFLENSASIGVMSNLI
jgi:hypothetical protein